MSAEPLFPVLEAVMNFVERLRRSTGNLTVFHCRDAVRLTALPLKIAAGKCMTRASGI